jgi:hypothetical protein
VFSDDLWLLIHAAVQTLELETARKAANAASKTFLRIQQQRTQRFNAAFEHIKCVAATIMLQPATGAVLAFLGLASRLWSNVMNWIPMTAGLELFCRLVCLWSNYVMLTTWCRAVKNI